MISYRTKRLHTRSRINRIFSRVVFFLERKLGVSVFSSLFMWGGTSPVGSDLERQSQRKNHSKNGFSLCRRSFTSPKIYSVRRSSVFFPGFLYWSGIILFSSDLSLFAIFWSSIVNPSFPFPFFLFISSFLIFDWEFGFYHSLFALPWGDSVVHFFGGKDEDFLHGPRFKVA